MKDFNLSGWSLRHPQMVIYLMVVMLAAGIFSFVSLGRGEDPDFTFKVMVVRTFWPGATAHEVAQQVTERVEKAVQEAPWVDVVKSYSKPGESMVIVVLKDYTPPEEVPVAWDRVRKKASDVKPLLPAGVQGPFPNDEFGDTSGIIYALTGDGFDLAKLRNAADDLARELRRLPDVKKVDLLGVQDERILVEISQAKLATLGLDPLLIVDTLARQNAMTPAGHYDTHHDRIHLRVSGAFDSVDSIREIGIRGGDRLLRLGDIADIRRTLADPPQPLFRYQGKPAVGVAITMTRGGDVLGLGERVSARAAAFEAELPLGMAIHQASDQPGVVRRSIGEFTKVLTEAVAIVLGVSFLSLGFRTGMVVALSIPLVLAITFLLMFAFGIDLQRISLGALIIALGLLVDDAIIAVEMMVVKIEQGWDRFQAATFAYTSTAFPMLTGTLITAAGFMPVGFAKSAAGEYTFSIFAVVTIALLVSWVVAVVFTPFIGYRILPADKLRAKASQHGEDIYASPFYLRLRNWITFCVRRRWLVIGGTIMVFVLSLAAFNLGVQKQFFPSSNRPELLVDLWLPTGTAITTTEREARRLETLLKDDPNIRFTLSYVGTGSPRFYLPLDQQLPNDNFAQFVILTHDDASREALRDRLMRELPTAFPGLRSRVLRLENGPPVGFPVQFRVAGENLDELRRQAEAVAAVIRADANTLNVSFDWNEKTKAVRLVVDQNRARVLGVSSQELSQTLNSLLSGRVMTQMRENDRLIDVVGRLVADERLDPDKLAQLAIHTASGRSVPLAQIARLEPVLEEGLVWRRNRLPTMTVRADITDGIQAPVVSTRLDRALDPLRDKLPPGYSVEMGGAIEESAKGESSIMAVMPAMLLVVLTLLMVQLQSMSRTLLVVLTAPFGLIGVTLFLLALNVPFGFVANLGVIALSGMIMRNSVILIDQIDRDIDSGIAQTEAIIGATVRRFRPIMLTAAAAILAMIPLTRSVFWGPMAVAIMGGLTVATLLTLFVLPALYAAWFRAPLRVASQ